MSTDSGAEAPADQGILQQRPHMACEHFGEAEEGATLTAAQPRAEEDFDPSVAYNDTFHDILQQAPLSFELQCVPLSNERLDRLRHKPPRDRSILAGIKTLAEEVLPIQ